MDEQEIQAIMARLGDGIAHFNPRYSPMPAGSAQDMFKLGADVLAKFTRLVVAVELMASCQMIAAEAVTEAKMERQLKGRSDP